LIRRHLSPDGTNSGLYVTDALYVRALTGLTPAEAGARLKSAVNIYYDPFYSPELANSKVNLTGGGKLLPIPRRGTIFRFQ